VLSNYETSPCQLRWQLVYIVIGDEKHVGAHDPARAASRERLATGVREWLHRWGYPWSEREGVICVDSVTHM
jgi:hypothetical protein